MILCINCAFDVFSLESAGIKDGVELPVWHGVDDVFDAIEYAFSAFSIPDSDSQSNGVFSWISQFYEHYFSSGVKRKSPPSSPINSSKRQKKM